MKTRARSIADGILKYLEGYFGAKVEELRAEGILLEHIAEFDSGYRDILVGLRDYPAIIVLERSREAVDAFTTDYSMLVGLAYKSEDHELLEENGWMYADILEDALDADFTLGGLCLDVNGLKVETDVTSGVFVVSAEFRMSIDRGGLPYGQGEAEEPESVDLSGVHETDTADDNAGGDLP